MAPSCLHPLVPPSRRRGPVHDALRHAALLRHERAAPAAQDHGGQGVVQGPRLGAGTRCFFFPAGFHLLPGCSLALPAPERPPARRCALPARAWQPPPPGALSTPASTPRAPCNTNILPRQVSAEAKDLVKRLLVVDPSQRLTCEQVGRPALVLLAAPWALRGACAPWVWACVCAGVEELARMPPAGPPATCCSPACTPAPHPERVPRCWSTRGCRRRATARRHTCPAPRRACRTPSRGGETARPALPAACQRPGLPSLSAAWMRPAKSQQGACTCLPASCPLSHLVAPARPLLLSQAQQPAHVAEGTDQRRHQPQLVGHSLGAPPSPGLPACTCRFGPPHVTLLAPSSPKPHHPMHGRSAEA